MTGSAHGNPPGFPRGAAPGVANAVASYGSAGFVGAACLVHAVPAPLGGRRSFGRREATV